MSENFSTNMQMVYSDGLSSLDCLKGSKYWRHRVEMLEREKYALIGAIDTMRPLYFEYDGNAETSALRGSIASVGVQMSRRLNIVNERLEFAVQQHIKFAARSGHVSIGGKRNG
jgi:hypothetical protein